MEINLTRLFDLFQVFGAQCFAIFGDILKVPVIGVSSSVLYPWIYECIANPENLAFTPSNLIAYPQNMNFWQRMYNFVNTVYTKWQFKAKTTKQTDILRKYVSPDAPDIREVEKKISIILGNSHMSINGIKHTTPAYIEVGGLHVRDEGVELPLVILFLYFCLSLYVRLIRMIFRYIDRFDVRIFFHLPVALRFLSRLIGELAGLQRKIFNK